MGHFYPIVLSNGIEVYVSCCLKYQYRLRPWHGFKSLTKCETFVRCTSYFFCGIAIVHDLVHLDSGTYVGKEHRTKSKKCYAFVYKFNQSHHFIKSFENSVVADRLSYNDATEGTIFGQLKVCTGV